MGYLVVIEYDVLQVAVAMLEQGGNKFLSDATGFNLHRVQVGQVGLLPDLNKFGLVDAYVGDAEDLHLGVFVNEQIGEEAHVPEVVVGLNLEQLGRDGRPLHALQALAVHVGRVLDIERDQGRIPAQIVQVPHDLAPLDAGQL